MSTKTKMSYAVTLLSLAMLFGASFANADEHEYEPRIDHFKVYRVESVEAGPTVELQGQFDRKPKGAILQKLTHFANPVSKNGEEILNPNAHLSWYVIEQREGEPIRELDVTNQFGKQRIRTGEARFLLVPTEKKEKNSTFPWGLDHFKCYEVMEGKPIEKEVVLKDQFVEEEAPVGAPVYFCVPVRKYHREE